MSIILKRIASHHQLTNKGFTLLEMLVMLIIIGLATTWTLPSWRRSVLQGQVDRYVNSLEDGLFDLKANAGKYKVSFLSTPPVLDTFVEPWELIEFTNSDGSAISGDDKRLCVYESDLEKCSIGARDPKYRFLKLENTIESRAIEVMIHLNGNRSKFEITPPGTINFDDVVFVIRSRQHASMTSQPLKERCLKLSGNGYIFQGNWNASTETCIRR